MSGVFNVNFEHYLTSCSIISIVNFEHVIAGWTLVYQRISLTLPVVQYMF